MDQTEKMFRELTEAHGIPGYEAEIRSIVRRYLAPLGAVEGDRIGSVLCRQGESGPRVMLAGHMDEIGFMVAHITKEGFLKFQQLGGWQLVQVTLPLVDTEADIAGELIYKTD